jgi:hypothetical protein
MFATGAQPEPSANAPCTRTTFLICCVMTFSSLENLRRLRPQKARVELKLDET